MNLFELNNDENHPAYKFMKDANVLRQYHFLESLVRTALLVNRPMISTAIIKALNFHAITCLHSNAGEFRPWLIRVGEYDPPEHFRVPDLMNDFVNVVNRYWNERGAFSLAAYCLWRLNYIHPFVNGNGRRARALCYFVICVKLNMWLPGKPAMPELIVANHGEYVALLKETDLAFREIPARFPEKFKALADFLEGLLKQQLASVSPAL